jgi:hypothetical protein
MFLARRRQKEDLAHKKLARRSLRENMNKKYFLTRISLEGIFPT